MKKNIISVFQKLFFFVISDAAKEKVEELQLDLDIIKTEMGDDSSPTTGEGSGASVTNFELKQLQAQNEKLRETLVRMRDLSAHEKSETLKLTKDAEELKSQNTDLTKQNDKFKNENETLEATINELQEQVDAALGMELIFLLYYYYFDGIF